MLVSGAYSWHNGVLVQVHVDHRMHYGMKEGTVTYAQRLADAGYRTAYLGKWHADWVKGPLDYGYQRISAVSQGPEPTARANLRPEDQLTSIPKGAHIAAERVVQWVGGDDWPVWREFDGPHESRRPHFMASRAEAVLGELCGGEDPWLMEVHFPEPHDPYAPHVEFARRYDADKVPLPDNWREEYVNKPGMNRKEAANYRDVTDEDVRQAIAHYWAYNRRDRPLCREDPRRSRGQRPGRKHPDGVQFRSRRSAGQPRHVHQELDALRRNASRPDGGALARPHSRRNRGAPAGSAARLGAHLLRRGRRRTPAL